MIYCIELLYWQLMLDIFNILYGGENLSKGI